jgi:hypothetical protein
MHPVDLERACSRAAVLIEAWMCKERLRAQSAALIAEAAPEHRADLAARFSKLDAEACRLINDITEEC